MLMGSTFCRILNKERRWSPRVGILRSYGGARSWQVPVKSVDSEQWALGIDHCNFVRGLGGSGLEVQEGQ